MEMLVGLLGIPLLVALLLLPFIVIITPFRWKKQSARLREIELRLQGLEAATAALARSSPAKTRAADATRQTAAQSKATSSVPEPEPRTAAAAASSAVAPSVRSEPPPAAPVAAAAARAADAGPGRPQLATAAASDSARVSGGATESKAETPAAAMEPVTEPVPEPALDLTGGPMGLRKLLRAVLRGRDASDWEGRFGRLWLNVIGVVVLVVGIVLLIGYSLRYLGPSGKVATGLAVGAALLGAGWMLERLERYRAFARALLGGGWALGYFTVYAAHNVEAAKIIDDPLWAMTVLFLVASGMIVHSFRYRSQVVTGLAYGLAFFAIAISPVSTYSLGAVALLG
jgi:hypothetical protein